MRSHRSMRSVHLEFPERACDPVHGRIVGPNVGTPETLFQSRNRPLSSLFRVQFQINPHFIVAQQRWRHVEQFFLPQFYKVTFFCYLQISFPIILYSPAWNALTDHLFHRHRATVLFGKQTRVHLVIDRFFEACVNFHTFLYFFRDQ